MGRQQNARHSIVSARFDEVAMFRFPMFTVLDPLAGYLVFPFLEAASKGLASE
jgi:hypothetical protein